MPVMNALIIAASGILVVFLMLVLLWMIIVGINKTVIAIEKTEEKPAEKAVKARPVPVQEIKPAPAPAAAPAPAPAPAPAAAPVYTAAPAAVPAPAYSVQTADSGIYGGNIAVFDDIDDKTVACIMAIISDETKIPLNQLIFKSIRLVQE
ncbi:MAG TPA: hypothetical protein DHW39_06315 [Erysipelotrichaceae bacterium]|nr:hypothetical protein [Erysipelotrichaceae bacterium]